MWVTGVNLNFEPYHSVRFSVAKNTSKPEGSLWQYSLGNATSLWPQEAPLLPWPSLETWVLPSHLLSAFSQCLPQHHSMQGNYFQASWSSPCHTHFHVGVCSQSSCDGFPLLLHRLLATSVPTDGVDGLDFIVTVLCFEFKYLFKLTSSFL